jgi:hypothetical protein
MVKRSVGCLAPDPVFHGEALVSHREYIRLALHYQSCFNLNIQRVGWAKIAVPKIIGFGG